MTLRVYRIVKRKYAPAILSGTGGLYAHGRWTSRGRPVVYTAGSISLAMLEFTVHYKRRGWVPASMLGRIDIPRSVDVEAVVSAGLPAEWRNARQPPKELRDIGDGWLERGENAVLRVPSAIVPEEHNFLLNPAHSDFGLARVYSVSDFIFDGRLVRTRRG